jgi:hypothetical protein
VIIVIILAAWGLSITSKKSHSVFIIAPSTSQIAGVSVPVVETFVATSSVSSTSTTPDH